MPSSFFSESALASPFLPSVIIKPQFKLRSSRRRLFSARSVSDDGEKRSKTSHRDAEPLEVQIAPHLQDPSSSKKNSSDSASLIERNLTKRKSQKQQKQPEGHVTTEINQSSQNEFMAYLSRAVFEDMAAWNKIGFLGRPSEWFYGPDGESLKGSEPQIEALLANKIFSKTEFKGVDLRFGDDEKLGKVLDNSGVEVNFTIFLGNGLVGFGHVTSGDVDAAQKQFQASLDENLPGMACVLTRIDSRSFLEQGVVTGEFPESLISVIIIPAYELTTFSLPEKFYAAISAGLVSAAAIFAYQIPLQNPIPELSSADPWLSLVCPLSLVLLIGSAHLGRQLAASRHKSPLVFHWPLTFPAPLIGCFGSVSLSKGCLPSRASLMDSCFGATVATLAASLLLLFAGQLTSGTSGTFTIFVQEDFFFLVPQLSTWLADSASLILAGNPDSVATAAVNPFTFMGLFGLQFMALNLLPIGASDGGRLVEALKLKSNKVNLPIKFADGAELLIAFEGVNSLLLGCSLLVCLGVGLRLAGSYQFGMLQFWLVYSLPRLLRRDWFQWDEVSEPGLLRKSFAAWILTLAAMAFVV